MSSLQEYLDEQENTHNQSFQVDNDYKANSAVRKVREFRQEIEKIKHMAGLEIEKIKQWESREIKRVTNDIEYFENLLHVYAFKQREIDGEFKSLALPNGRIRFKKQQPKYELKDDVVLESLKSTGKNEFIKVTEKPKLAEIKKYYHVVNGELVDTETGEKLAGASVIEREDKFEVVDK